MAIARQQRLCILQGQAVGDALGAPTEFLPTEKAAARYGERLTDYVGGSSLGFAPGEFTDDTQMVLCVLAAYRRGGPDLLAAAVEEFTHWRDSRPVDIGNLTRKAICLFRRHGVAGGLAAWVDEGCEAAGNGGLMRAAASVIAGRVGEELYAETLGLTALTHADPRSLLACLATAAALEALAAGARAREAWEAGLGLQDEYPVMDVLAPAFGDAAAPVADRLPAGRAAVRAAVRQGLEGPPGPQSGYVLHTLRTAAHFSASPDFLPGVGAIAARGDDSDTAAAVAGALLAAAGHPVPDRLLARLHCLHRGWRLWTPPGGAADLEAFVP